MSDDKITFRVDSDTKRRLDSGHLNKSAVLRSLAAKYARSGDTTEAALRVEQQEKEERLTELKREKSDIQADIDRLEREISRIDRRLEQHRNQVTEEAVEIAERIQDGRFKMSQLTEDNPAVKNWAQKAGLEVDRFIFEVQQELDE